MTNPGLLALAVYRLQEVVQDAGRMRVAGFLRTLNVVMTGADFVVGCEVGGGLLMHHPVGVVIGHGASVGKGCTILQGVTVGERYADGSGDHAYPVLRDRVTVGAGAKILGRVEVGEGAVIGANSVVLDDIPDGSIAVGVPARIIGSA
ncbi:serine O-acetyltransferase [Rhodococcus pseudokoreensis]|uniref:Serine acetyltransferase n=1 Tax=Rhodococcus pseudokoreensis TaxID=2811421 RepID=A0A974ZTF7_9NOCA|nr:serine O-acetyltransferase [Rhodococcus pseudokoreensis]QSE89736.1 serine O-acetyltransferase [Rhodococcus pseudokoreensis]